MQMARIESRRKVLAGVCPHCGQVVPPKGLFRAAPIKRRIYEYVAAHPAGVSRQQIFNHVWADDVDGGPEWMNVISVHVKGMRPVLAREGLTISCARGPGSTHRLERLP
jgi:DNA-binding response OmpR family regulator